MHVLTTSLCYPSATHPDQGVFIQRRARAVNELPATRVDVISPQPCCPLLRPKSPLRSVTEPLPTVYPRMFSAPLLSRVADGWCYARALERAVRTQESLRAARPDLLDAHFVYPDGVGAWLAGRRLHLPVCVTVRGKIVSLSRRTLRRWQIQHMLRGVEARMAVSRSLEGWVHRVAGSDLVVDVIPNGIDTRAFHLVHRDEARAAIGWPTDARYILAVGHLQHLKGFDRLVRIWSEVRDALGDARLMLVGSERGEHAFARQLRDDIHRVNQDAGKRVIDYAGVVPPGVLNVMYNAADISVVASRSEGWCNAISESLAVGTPVVATDVGGNAEQLCSTELGRLVPNGNERALASAIVEAVAYPWNRVLISAHGSARRWSHVAEEVMAVYRRTVEQWVIRAEPDRRRMREARRRLADDIATAPWQEASS